MPPKGGARRAARSAALTKGFLGSLCCCSAVKGSRGPPGDLSTVRAAPKGARRAARRAPCAALLGACFSGYGCFLALVVSRCVRRDSEGACKGC